MKKRLYWLWMRKVVFPIEFWQAVFETLRTGQMTVGYMRLQWKIERVRKFFHV